VNGREQTRSGNDEFGLAPHNCYRCLGDDNWVSVAVATDEEWHSLAKAIGNPPWTDDRRFAESAGRWENRHELDGNIGSWTADRTPAEVTGILQNAGVAAAPSYKAPDLLSDPHVLERDLVAVVRDGTGRDWQLVRLGGKLSRTPLRADRASPELGEHNHYAFNELVGLDDAEVARLRDDGVFT
jgi:benzylsuccinate CoA-transferase BbsF subunit